MQIKELLGCVIGEGASDLHLTVGLPPMIRVDGQIKPMMLPKLTDINIKEIVGQLLEDRSILLENFKVYGEVDFSYSVLNIGRFRVNIFKQKAYWAVAIRMISEKIPSMEELGLPRRILEQILLVQRGLILITGPTGSGKSTTLATMIDYINQTRGVHILTLEDPIEYVHAHKMAIVHQREIGSDSKSYETGLRAALREDPDVILIGEMRDKETIATAITAAQTGHLVLSTLHTMGAIQTIDRMIDVFPPYQQQQIRVQLSNSLIGVISQQLIPREDQQGRCVGLEIMKMTPAIAHLIREEKTHQIYSHIQTGKLEDMMTMEQSLIEYYRKGWISLERAYQFAQNKEELKRLAGR